MNRALLQGLEVCDQVVLLFFRERGTQKSVVVVDHSSQRGEPAVVKESAFLVCPQTSQRRGSVLVRRRSVRLEIVDAHFGRRVHVEPGLSKKR